MNCNLGGGKQDFILKFNHLKHGANGDDDNGEITFWNINIDKRCGRESDPILSLKSMICAKYILYY